MARKKTAEKTKPVKEKKGKSRKSGKASGNRKGGNSTRVAESEAGEFAAGVLREFPIDVVEKMTEKEALAFRALDAELRNALQGIKLVDLEIERLERDFRDKVKGLEVAFRDAIADKQAERNQLKVMFESREKDYKEVVEHIAKSRGLDPTQMALDPDARTIRDLRGSMEESETRN